MGHQQFHYLGYTINLSKRNLVALALKVDINPPGKFTAEAKTLLRPIPFSVNSLTLPDLFAGKIHALLC